MKRVARKLLLGTVITLASLGFLELAVRLAVPSPDAVKLPRKAEGAVRVVTLGGSTVYGTPVPELGIMAVLKHELARMGLGTRLDLINLGKPGIDSDEVLSRLRQSLTAQPDLIVVLMGHNEYLSRRGEHPDPRADLRDRLMTSALLRLLDSVAGRMRDPHHARSFVMPDRLEPYDRTSEWFMLRRERFRRNLAAAVELCRGAGVPLVLCTAPSNLADWPPVNKGIAWASPIPNYDELLHGVTGLIDEDRLDEADERIAKTARQHGEDAMLLYLQGRIAQAKAKSEQARMLFVRARDLDPCPWRAMTDINDITRSFANSPGVAVADVEDAFTRAAVSGLVGFDLVADNCHPTLRGSAVGASDIAGRIHEASWLDGLTAAQEPAALLADYRSFLHQTSPETDLWREWRFQNAIYCMKSPFYYYTASMKYIEEGLKVHPDDWRLFANRASIHWLEGRIEEGRADLSHAEKLKGGPLEIGDRSVTPYLKEAMERAGLSP
jgi:lysophospholipase L1-like esterase